jgi:hypothetical protein
MQGFLKIQRTNGETFYFNLVHVSMIYENVSEKNVLVIGTGYEKKFVATEAAELMNVVQGMVATAAQ